MRCPVCKTVSLENIELADHLAGEQCPSCGGVFIRAKGYWDYLASLGHQSPRDFPPELPAEAAAQLPVTESAVAKLCPGCSHFLTRYPIGHGVSFHLEHCQACGSFWLDRNEFPILQSRNLHERLHLITAAPWQHQLDDEKRQGVYEHTFLQKLGPATYGEIKRIKAWLDTHPQKAELYAYLTPRTDHASTRTTPR